MRCKKVVVRISLPSSCVHLVPLSIQAKGSDPLHLGQGSPSNERELNFAAPSLWA